VSVLGRLYDALGEVPCPDNARVVISHDVACTRWSVNAIEFDDNIRPTCVTRRSREIKVYPSYGKARLREIMETSVSELLSAPYL
jgi:hypothetical protein